MTTHRHTRPGAALAVLALALVGCSEPPAGPAGPRTATVAFDAGPLLQSPPEGRPVSVIALARLVVTTAGGERTQEAPLDADATGVAFEVTVPEGPARFEAQVVSNNASLLYTGARDVPVTSDGFEVVLDLEAVAPVLVAAPDSQRTAALLAPAGSPFVLRNRGLDAVTWSVESVEPPLDGCGEHGCLRILPSRGTVSAGASETLRVSSVSTPAALYRIRLASAEGTVDLLADADPASVIEVLVTNPAGAPMPGRRVTVRACSTGSEEGSPGLCVPDETLAPLTGTTDDGGTLIVPGLPEGYWEVRPDPFGLEGILPSATTLLPEPGTTRQVHFTGYPVG